MKEARTKEAVTPFGEVAMVGSAALGSVLTIRFPGSILTVSVSLLHMNISTTKITKPLQDI